MRKLYIYFFLYKRLCVSDKRSQIITMIAKMYIIYSDNISIQILNLFTFNILYYLLK